MKPALLTTLAALLLGYPVCRAQSTEVEAEEESTTLKTVIWGIKANLNAELPSKWRNSLISEKMFNSGFGASVGCLANVYLGKNFYFEPELALFYEGYSYDVMAEVAPNSPYVNAGPTVTKLGLRLPLMVGYYINISDSWGLDVFTGPQLSYAFYGHASASNESVKENYDLMHVFSGAYAQRRFDLGWKVGVGFPVEHFLISLEADLGITNQMKQTWTMRENRVSLGVTYYF